MRNKKIYGLYLELRKKHGEARKYWPGWCARRKTAKLREEIAIGAILTQRTNWRNVEMALTNLRNQGALSIRGIDDLLGKNRDCGSRIFSPHVVGNKSKSAALARRPNTRTGSGVSVGMSKIVTPHSLSRLEMLIRPAGFYHQKARRLWEFCRLITENYGSLEKFGKLKVGEAREKLLSLWGIGPETADSILLYALGKQSFVIDEYTKRLFRSKKILKNYTYDYMKAFCEQNLPQDAILYRDFHALIVVEEKGEKAAKMR